MSEPHAPSSEVAAERVAGPAWSDLSAHAHAVEPLPFGASAAPARQDATWRADLRAARTVVRHTVSMGALAAGLIEYMGWQIARRASDASTVVPLGEWALGLARNLGGAVGVGLALACLAMLVPHLRKRPLRAASAAFAFGVAGFLGFLSFLLSLAP